MSALLAPVKQDASKPTRLQQFLKWVPDLEALYLVGKRQCLEELQRFVLQQLMEHGGWFSFDDAFCLMCGLGHFSAVRWLLETNKDIALAHRGNLAFEMACEEGHLYIAIFLFSQNRRTLTRNTSTALQLACERGHMPIIRWLLWLSQEEKDKGHADVLLSVEEALECACIYGQLSVVQELYTPTETNANDLLHWFQLACLHGHLSVALFLEQQQQQQQKHSMMNFALFFEVCSDGHWGVAHHFLSNNPAYLMVCGDNVLVRACQDGNLAMVTRLLAQKDSCNLGRDGINDGFVSAIEHEQFQVAMYLLSNSETRELLNLSNCFEQSLSGACFAGKTAAVKYILSVDTIPSSWENNEEVVLGALVAACEQGHVETAQEVLAHFPLLDLSAHDEWVFRATCDGGHLPAVQWLFRMKPGIQVSAKEFAAVVYACERGNLDILEWLLLSIANALPLFRASPSKERALCAACQHGHTRVVQWLLQQVFCDHSPSPATLNDAFSQAYGQGHGAIVQRLLHLQPALCTEPNVFNAFYVACEHGRSDVVRFLAQQHPLLLKPYSLEQANAFLATSVLDHLPLVEPVLEWFETLNPQKYKCVRNSKKAIQAAYIVAE